MAGSRCDFYGEHSLLMGPAAIANARELSFSCAAIQKMNPDLVLAGFVLVIHLLFILWVIGGVLVVRRYPRLKWVHIASLAYSIFVEIVPWPPCPLTVLEQMLEERAGIAAYHGSFLVHYLDTLVYPNLPLALLVGVAVGFCAANLVYYIVVWSKGVFVHRDPAR